ncbi:MAG: YceD family protein [Terriglobales bacterium]
MFISIQSLEDKPLNFREQFRPQALDLGPEIEQQTPLATSGRAELVEEHEAGRKVIQDIRVVGRLSTRITVKCARCLEPVASDLESTFDLLYRPRGIERRGPESSISEAETEIGFYSGEGLLLEEVLKEQVLLAVPLKAVCREDCKGLCPSCGRNRNRESCDCAPAASDVRWAALGNLRDQLKS